MTGDAPPEPGYTEASQRALARNFGAFYLQLLREMAAGGILYTHAQEVAMELTKTYIDSLIAHHDWSKHDE